MKVMIKEGAEERLNDASGRGADGDAATLSEIRKFANSVSDQQQRMLVWVSFAICVKDAQANKSR